MTESNSSLVVKVLLAIVITIGIIGLGASLLSPDISTAAAEKQVAEELNVFTVYQAPVGAEAKGEVTSEHPLTDEFTEPVTLNE
jgi:hypothetical protein